jgi:penicillin-binding protein 1A
VRRDRRGIRLVRVNPATGPVARPGERDVIWEAFKPGTEPTVPGPVLDADPGTGVLY